MKKKIEFQIKLFFVLSLSIFFTDCKKENTNTVEEAPSCFSYSRSVITNVTGSHSGSTHTVIPFQITYYLNNSCGRFWGFSEDISGNTRTIRLYAMYEGCDCFADTTAHISVYNFTTSNSGTYFLKFMKESNIFIVDTLVIN